MLKEYYQITKNEKHKLKIKPIKTGKELGTTYCLGCKDYTHNFKPPDVKVSLAKNRTALFVNLVNQDF